MMILETIRNALINAWPMLIIFLSIVVLVRLTYLISNHKKIVIHEELFNFMFLVYILMLFEFLTSTETGRYGSNLIPFHEITRYKFMSNLFIFNVIGNIVLFMPFGFFLAKYCKLKDIWFVLIVSTLSSGIVECVQYKIGRAFDIDDIILNLTGGILGYLIYVILKNTRKHLPSFLQNNLFYNIVTILLMIGIGYLFYHYIGFGWF